MKILAKCGRWKNPKVVFLLYLLLKRYLQASLLDKK